MDVKGKTVTVMGLGLHGGAVGTVRWLHEQGAHIIVTDMKARAQLVPTLRQLQDLPDITYHLGEHQMPDFTDVDLVVKNPAVPTASPYLAAARTAGVPIELDSSLFWEACPSADIIGVTGSKGKTTTATAIAHLLRSAGSAVVLTGVEGSSPLTQLARISSRTTVVFELSSWRLEALATHRQSPAVAVVTSLYRDHLNTYKSFEAYASAKQTIMRYQKPADVALLNRDDPRVKQWESDAPGQVWWYSLHPLPDEAWGISWTNSIIRIRLPHQTRQILPPSLPLMADHQRRNILPAIAMAVSRGATDDQLAAGLQTLPKVRHRLEHVATTNGVDYINDSAATIPEAVTAALDALADQPIIHIVGGTDKNLQFDDLVVRERESTVKAIIFLPGTATELLKLAWQAAGNPATPLHEAATMIEAVQTAARVSAPGDTVLLSPGAASFGLFQHEFDRGDQFCDAVKALA